MLIQGDTRANSFLLESLLANEAQFLVTYKSEKIRVAFSKGDWKIMKDDGEYFVFSDGVFVSECSNKLLKGLLDQRIEANKTDNDWRKTPAKIMREVLDIWIEPSEKIQQIDVTQAERNGWFTDFDERTLTV
jgi:hypothetical protein